jgi:two-component system, chemotaxis family, CheB/CheR fusion protein
MSINQIDRLETYIRFLQENPVEVMTLFRELLIGVTQFFRDPEAFTALEESIIPKIFKSRAPGQGVRVWTAGCSTGEEAYTIAMLLQEHASKLQQDHPIQVFATDIDSESIDIARTGVYPAGISADVTPERLKRHFDHKGETYAIKKTIREIVVFADQNMISDPPFSKLDLLTCRNLLIYLKPELQKKLFPLFHYALRPGGYLMLGTSETIGRAVDDFTVVNRQQKIYQRTGEQQHREGMPFHHEKADTGRLTPQLLVEGTPTAQQASLKEWAEAQLLHSHTPACAVIDAGGEIHYIHGRTGQYLEPATGEASLNIFKMARLGLKIELVNAVRQTARTAIPVRRTGLKVKTNGDFITVNLQIESALDHPGTEKLFLVILEERPEEAVELVSDGKKSVAADQKDEHIARLEYDLRAKEEYLQSVIEELETANEELKSTNEELQSSNEELQSTNEELETSREELQSVNEELSTVNNELVGKIDDLTLVNNDMSNLLASTEIGTLFLDHDQNILRFTPAAVHLIPLMPSDIGRPVSHFATNLNYENLGADIQTVLDTLRPVETELQARDGSWHLMRIMPYRTTENVIEGAVLTFVSISEYKRLQTALQESQTLSRAVSDSECALTVLDFSGKIMVWNPAAEQLYGWNEDEILGMNIDKLVPVEGREALQIMLEKLAVGEIVEPITTNRITKDGHMLEVRLTATNLIDKDGVLYGVSMVEQVLNEVPPTE